MNVALECGERSLKNPVANPSNTRHDGIMSASPDPRWSNVVGTIGAAGRPLPMSFDGLQDIARPWSQLLTEPIPEGIATLLATSRSLFVHSWFDYEFMAVAVMVALQAVETTF